MDDFYWMDVFMKKVVGLMDGLSFYYYMILGDFWKGKGLVIDFMEDEWFIMMKKVKYIDELI